MIKINLINDLLNKAIKLSDVNKIIWIWFLEKDLISDSIVSPFFKESLINNTFNKGIQYFYKKRLFEIDDIGYCHTKTTKQKKSVNKKQITILTSYIELKNKYKSDADLYFKLNNISYKIKNTDYRDILIKHIKVCPYCWKTAFFKRIDNWKKYYSFELDHFLPKSHYPQYSLNTYNLIPVCKACNSSFSKGNKEYNNWEYFHPYFWWLKINSWIWKKMDIEKDFDDIFDFSNVTNLKNFRSSELNIWTSHIDYFNLDQIYKFSSDSLLDYKFFLNKRDIINFRLTNKSKATYSNSDKDSYKLEKSRFISEYFKHWYPENKSELLKVPNWKMKQDLIKKFIKRN
jgi:5-methylcytosine-specific restriction endonuclease McrA